MIDINKKTLRKIFFGVIGCIAVFWLLHEAGKVSAVFSYIWNVISPFVFGGGIAFILNVPMRSVEKWFKGVRSDKLRRLIAIVITLILILLVIGLVFLLLIPQVIETGESLVPQLQRFFGNVKSTTIGFLDKNPDVMEFVAQTGVLDMNWSSFVEKIITWLGDSISTILGGTVSVIAVAVGAVVNFVVAIVFAIYCLFEKERLARHGRKLMYSLVPEHGADEVIRVLRLSNSTFSNFLSGQCLEVVILGAMVAVGMAIFRLPYIPLVSVLVAVTAFIPVVGAFLGCFIGAFLICVNNPLQALIFIAIFLVIQMIEGNIIYPKVVGSSIGLPSIWVFAAVAIGGTLFGISGMFLMVPFASVLYTLLREFTQHRLVLREIDPEKLKEHPPEIISHRKEKRHKKRQLRFARRNSKKENKPE